MQSHVQTLQHSPLTSPDPGFHSIASVLEILRTVDQQHESGVLTLLGEDHVLGSLILSEGGICFIRGVSGQRRFGDLLRERNPESAAVLSKALRSAKASGRLLGEVLLSLSDVPLEDIRACLVEQIAASLCKLVETDWVEARFEPLPGQFDQRLTFTAAEAYIAAVSAMQMESSQAVRLYDEFATQADIAILGLRSGNKVLPIRMSDFTGHSISDFRVIGRSLAAIINPPALEAADIRPSVVMLGSATSIDIVCATDLHVAFLRGMDPGVRARVLRFLSTASAS